MEKLCLEMIADSLDTYVLDFETGGSPPVGNEIIDNIGGGGTIVDDIGGGGDIQNA